jgi:hypothetical protein
MQEMSRMQNDLDKSLIKHGWSIGLYNGNMVDVRNLSDADIDIDSIAQSLSLQCRYMGHVKRHYSVAQHLCYVCDMIVKELGSPCRAAFAGLIHDFPEAFLHDLVRGIKVGICEQCDYASIDASIMKQIARIVGLDDFDDYHDVVKKWDNRVLKSEVLSLTNASPQWIDLLKDIEEAPIQIAAWNPSVAKIELMIRYNSYTALIKKGVL